MYVYSKDALTFREYDTQLYENKSGNSEEEKYSSKSALEFEKIIPLFFL
jgi:hypothetical protein